jgi:hypothetical protein
MVIRFSLPISSREPSCSTMSTPPLLTPSVHHCPPPTLHLVPLSSVFPTVPLVLALVLLVRLVPITHLSILPFGGRHRDPIPGRRERKWWRWQVAIPICVRSRGRPWSAMEVLYRGGQIWLALPSASVSPFTGVVLPVSKGELRLLSFGCPLSD